MQIYMHVCLHTHWHDTTSNPESLQARLLALVLHTPSRPWMTHEAPGSEDEPVCTGQTPLRGGGPSQLRGAASAQERQKHWADLTVCWQSAGLLPSAVHLAEASGCLLAPATHRMHRAAAQT